MGKSQLAVLLAASLLTLVAGCQMGATDEEQLTAALGQWKVAVEAQDIDKMMELYSDDFEGERGKDKEGVRQVFSMTKDRGALEDVDMDISEAEINIEGDKATVGPILYAGSWGEIEMMRILKKEADGVWRVVGAEQY